MNLTKEQHGKYMIIKASGRLDASWAEYFSDFFFDLIRNGHHQLIIDAGAMTYLSSAGIRSLLSIDKELNSVKGNFSIMHAPANIINTLVMTGFKSWLLDSYPDGIKGSEVVEPVPGRGEEEVYILDHSAELSFYIAAGWKPWQAVETGKVNRLNFPQSFFALGIGSAAETSEEAAGHFGDFMAIDGHVIFQPPEERIRPDFLIAEKDYIPDLYVIQGLCCQGKMSHLVRFEPGENIKQAGISRIAERVLEITNSESAAFVLLAEADGLVGAAFIRSPGQNSAPGGFTFPEIKDWLSFSGERVHHGQQCLVLGIISRSNDFLQGGFLKPLPSMPDIAGHFHAAVFPYQPLQNGKIDLARSVRKLLGGPPPLALLHLVEDSRPAIGLGQSSFTRGACWCAAIKNRKEQKS